MYIMSAEDCKNMDKYAIEKLYFPSIILMENAATEVCNRIKDSNDNFIIICGTGNNGGDGLAIGRKLLIQEKKVCFIIVNPREKYSKDFHTNFKIVGELTDNIHFIKNFEELENIKELFNENASIIDCLFGVGLNRELDSFYKKLINLINRHKGNIISIDVPSGLDANNGLVLGAAIKANKTYTFEVIKKGFLNYKALEYLGEVQVLSIGIPDEAKTYISEKIIKPDRQSYSKFIKRRKIYGHKGDYGRSVIVSGSNGFYGAAYISTEACVKSGSGLVTLITSIEGQKILSSKLVEAMTMNFSNKEVLKELLSKANSIAFGPGIAKGNKSEQLFEFIIDNSRSTLIIDAEGINMLANRPDLLQKVKDRAILTPHPGEMSRLTKKTITDIEENRIEIAKEFAKKNKCILLLKGYNSIITDGESIYINSSGNSKMASGGMGDCLTGIITALVAQGQSKIEAALLGAYIHGRCGEISGENKYSVIATDIIKNIPVVMNELIIT